VGNKRGARSENSGTIHTDIDLRNLVHLKKLAVTEEFIKHVRSQDVPPEGITEDRPPCFPPMSERQKQTHMVLI
jgi:hypothetical protein